MKTVIEMAQAVGFPLLVFDGEPHVSAELERLIELVRADEREACAKVCEQDEFQIYETAGRCAAAIRARSNT